VTRRDVLRPDGQPADVDCGCCGRFIGPELTCPYCGADAEQRGPVRLLRALALILAVGGLTALVVQARVTPVPLVQVATVRPGMAMAHVRVAGAAVTAPRVAGDHGQTDYVSFDLDDGTGRITVAAARHVARALTAAPGTLPRRGDRVEAQGRLSLTPDRRPRLFLDDARGLQVTVAKGDGFR
jgi:hypothetical protein